MKKFTHGDGIAIMILVAKRMGLNPNHVDDANRHLESGSVHPMTSAAMEKEAVRCNDLLRGDASLITQANAYAEILKAEHGFLVDISKEAFLELQSEAESLELDHAQGRDLPGHDKRLQVIDAIMNASSWTLHPDYGCILKSDVNARDRAAMQPG